MTFRRQCFFRPMWSVFYCCTNALALGALLVCNSSGISRPVFYRGSGLKLHGATFFLRFVFILTVLHLNYFSFLDMFVLRILILDETNHFKVACVCVNKSMSVGETKCMRVSEYEVWSVSAPGLKLVATGCRLHQG